jgi:hypothetical protein
MLQLYNVACVLTVGALECMMRRKQDIVCSQHPIARVECLADAFAAYDFDHS